MELDAFSAAARPFTTFFLSLLSVMTQDSTAFILLSFTSYLACRFAIDVFNFVLNLYDGNHSSIRVYIHTTYQTPALDQLAL